MPARAPRRRRSRSGRRLTFAHRASDAPPASSRSAASGSIARHGNAFPHLARPELPHEGRGAADVVGIAVREHESSRRRMPASAAPARRRGRRRRTPTARVSPPASTSSVAPRGNRTNAASPWPTSMNVTCSRPSPKRGRPRPRLGRDPDRGEHGAGARPRGAPARRSRRAQRRRRTRRRSSSPRDHDAGAATRHVDAGTKRTRSADRTRPVRAEMRDAPGHSRARPRRDRRQEDERPSRRSARRAISGIARKFSARPANVTRENTNAPTGNSTTSLASDATTARIAARDRRAASSDPRHERARRARMANVAPHVSRNAGIERPTAVGRRRGAAATTASVFKRRPALVDRAAGEVQRPPSTSRDRPTRRRRRDRHTPRARRWPPASPPGPSTPARRNTPTA